MSDTLRLDPFNASRSITNRANDSNEGRPSGRRRKGSRRIRAIVDLLDPALPVWDLCCDHGYIGRAALEEFDETPVVFVDRAPQTIERLATSLQRFAGLAGRHRVICAELSHLDLPASPVNFVIAGVSAPVIRQFLDRLAGRRGDRIVCNTFQDAGRFEASLQGAGLNVRTTIDVVTRAGTQRIWQLEN